MAARLYRFPGQNTDRSGVLKNVIESKYYTLTMLAIVVSNTVVMIFETYDIYYQKYSTFFLHVEKIYLCIYIIECCLKLWIYSWRFFKTLWNDFDFFIILINIVDLLTQELTHERTQSSLQIDHNQQTQTQFERINQVLKLLRVLRILRSFRALRVLRTIRFIRSINTIVQTCAKALPAITSITFIMIVITCISAIIARHLFGDICPEKFSNLVQTFFSLFTLLTLDDWYSVYQVCADHDYASFQLIFCLIYIFIINFILLNLLMAVLVDSFQQTLDFDTSKDNQSKGGDDIDEPALKNLTKLSEEYCGKDESKEENENVSLDGRKRNVSKPRMISKDYQRNQSLLHIEEIMKQYYMLMESLEFRMERHEQLTKLAQRSIHLTLMDQDNRKMIVRK